MVAKKGAKKAGNGRKKGGALRQSGNGQRGKGPFSNFLKKIPIIGGPMGGVAGMMGMGYPSPYHYQVHQQGRGDWGDLLSNTIAQLGKKGVSDLSNLARKL